MDRRKFIGYSILGTGSIFGFTGCDVLNQNSNKKQQTIKTQKTSTLPIPPLAEYSYDQNKKIFNLSIQSGQTNFIDTFMTPTFGVNGSFLGPTIKVNTNDKLSINVKNNLDENTTLHWHGLHINGKNDGGPHQVILPNQQWSANFQISQRASTAWYHPHLMGKTGSQVYKGIAGLFLIEDETSKNLPNEYGIDDIPLVLQDRRFDSRGEFVYIQSMHDRMMGVTGDHFLINGAINPLFRPTKTKTRFRILNGSNSRIYLLELSNQKDFTLVATDGGFVEKPLLMNKLLLAPGERAEMIVDIDSKEEFALVDLLSKKHLLQIKASDSLQKSKNIPNQLCQLPHIKVSKNETIREFDLSMGMGKATINGKEMDLNRIDQYVPKNTSEIWRIKNNSSFMMNMAHPFHIHGCSFEILSRNGDAPYIFEKGLKDTVLVNKNEIVDVRVIFTKKANKNNPFMYHCHNLEHEDLGMMGQFVVQ